MDDSQKCSPHQESQDKALKTFEMLSREVDVETTSGRSHLTKLGRAALLGHLVSNDVEQEVFVQLNEATRKKWVRREFEKEFPNDIKALYEKVEVKEKGKEHEKKTQARKDKGKEKEHEKKTQAKKDKGKEKEKVQEKRRVDEGSCNENVIKIESDDEKAELEQDVSGMCNRSPTHEEERPTELTVQVVPIEGDPFLFKIKPDAPLQRLMDAFCSHRGRSRFRFDCRILRGDETCKKVSILSVFQDRLPADLFSAWHKKFRCDRGSWSIWDV